MTEPLPFRSALAARLASVTLLWLSRTLMSLVIVCPALFVLVGSGNTSGPDRDAPLFRRGALHLLELARGGYPLLGSATESGLALGGLCAVLGLIPLAAALDLLRAREADAFAARLARGVELFPGFIALSGITLLAQAALLIGASLLSTGLSAALRGQDERLLTVTPIAVFCIGLLGCAVLGAILDVARGVLVQHELNARAALLEALSILRQSAAAVLLGSYASIAGSTFAWLCAAWLLTRIDLSNPVTRGIALAFVLHQLAILLSISVRVRWLTTALSLSAPPSAPELRSARG